MTRLILTTICALVLLNVSCTVQQLISPSTLQVAVVSAVAELGGLIARATSCDTRCWPVLGRGCEADALLAGCMCVAPNATRARTSTAGAATRKYLITSCYRPDLARP